MAYVEKEIAILSDRSVIRVTGTEAEQFLQGLITNDINKTSLKYNDSLELDELTATFAGLLTPQGKILFDFFIMRTNDGFLLDISKEQANEFTKRLGFYKLRADIEIKDLSDEFQMIYMKSEINIINSSTFSHPKTIGLRFYYPIADIDQLLESGKQISLDDYHKQRILLGIPEGGKDYVYGDTFPHEACYDLLDGVDFQKGCYVGQEVVSRMHHRGTARKRIVKVESSEMLPKTGTDVEADGQVIGRLGSTLDTHGLALIRLDRAAKALEKNLAITIAGKAVTLSVPEWADYTLE